MKGLTKKAANEIIEAAIVYGYEIMGVGRIINRRSGRQYTRHYIALAKDGTEHRVDCRADWRALSGEESPNEMFRRMMAKLENLSV